MSGRSSSPRVTRTKRKRGDLKDDQEDPKWMADQETDQEMKWVEDVIPYSMDSQFYEQSFAEIRRLESEERRLMELHAKALEEYRRTFGVEL